MASIDVTGAFGPPNDMVDMFGAFGTAPFGYYGGLGNFPYWRDQTKRGEVIPVYITEPELKFIRDRSRVLCAQNETAISALTSRRNYVIGKGFTYRALPLEELEEGETAASDSLVDDYQKFIDAWVEFNDVTERSAESCWRGDEDGEAFIRLFFEWRGSFAGMTTLRSVEPELVRAPHGDLSPEHSFGIATDPKDVESIRGYYIVEDPLNWQFPRLVPEKEVVHIKLNVRSTAKRGLPVLYPVEANLRRCEDLLASMTSMAKTRAKIAMIRKFKQSQKAAVETFTQGLTEVTATDPLNNLVRNFERLPYGAILNTDAQKDYEFPTAQSDVSGFVECLDAEYRAIASRLKMPEWMLSANAQNQNYSNAFVSESDSVKSFEFLQDLYKRKWGEGRTGNRMSILWRCIDHAIAVGVLPEEGRTKIRISVEPQPLVVRDKDREAATAKLYRDMNVKSRQTIQQEIGLDGAHEDELMLKDKLPQQVMGTQMQGETPYQRQGEGALGNDPQVRGQAVRNFSTDKT